MPMVSLKLMAGAARSIFFAEIAARWMCKEGSLVRALCGPPDRRSHATRVQRVKSCHTADHKSEDKASSTLVARREARIPKVFPTALFRLEIP
jgi:hypothetical protein